MGKPMSESAVGFERASAVDAESPTLIEGFPGLGLVASIAVDQITKQLGLEYYGEIRCDSLPPVASFDDGRFQDLLRVYAGEDPSVMTLRSDLMIPPDAIREVSQCTLNDLSPQFDRAIFIAGAPANSEEEVGDVRAACTTDDIRGDLESAGIEFAEESGLIGGITGALLMECYREGIPAAALIVKARPNIPDPGAAQALIESSLEPLVEFDIDTTELQEQADQIQEQLQQVVQQYQQMQAEQSTPQTPNASMFQ